MSTIEPSLQSATSTAPIFGRLPKLGVSIRVTGYVGLGFFWGGLGFKEKGLWCMPPLKGMWGGMLG